MPDLVERLPKNPTKRKVLAKSPQAVMFSSHRDLSAEPDCGKSYGQEAEPSQRQEEPQPVALHSASLAPCDANIDLNRGLYSEQTASL